MSDSLISYALAKAAKPLEAIGQLGGHVKSGTPHPKGARTSASMALISALPLEPGSDKMVVTFLDRSAPVETFDNKPDSGDNAVIIVDKSELGLSIVKGVCPGDWRGIKVEVAEEMTEPTDLDVDHTGLDMDASDAWVDMVDDIGCDCTKIGGYPLWTNAPRDIEDEVGEPVFFHHRITGDIVDFALGEGAVIFVFVNEKKDKGYVLWEKSGGGMETTYGHYD